MSVNNKQTKGKMKRKDQIQQGDVILKRIASLPEGTVHVIKKDNNITLALGEVTGHHHTILDAPGSKLVSVDKMKYLVVEEKAVLTHQEHNPVTIEPGVYAFGIVQEWDYFSQQTNRVMD